MNNERLDAALDKENYDKLKDEVLPKPEVSTSNQDKRLKHILEVIEDYEKFKQGHGSLVITDIDRLAKVKELNKTVKIIEDIRKKR